MLRLMRSPPRSLTDSALRQCYRLTLIYTSNRPSVTHAQHWRSSKTIHTGPRGQLVVPVGRLSDEALARLINTAETLSGELFDWWWPRKDDAFKRYNQGRTLPGDTALTYVTPSEAGWYLERLIDEMWPKNKRLSYEIRSIPLDKFKQIMQQGTVATMLHSTGLESLLQIIMFLVDRSGTLEYDIMIELASKLAQMGRPDCKHLSAAFALRHIKNKLPSKLSLQDIKSDLSSVVAETNGKDWRALVLLGLVEQHQRQYEAAMAYFNKALGPAAAERPPSSETARKIDSMLYDIAQATFPWTCGVNLILAARSDSTFTEAKQRALFRHAKGLIQRGVQGDDARAHYLSALPAQMEYVSRETQEHFDSDLQATHPPRDSSSIGKSSAWLFYMSRAAATNQPDAQLELGQYYWDTAHRYLDDEPPDDMKPTALDRWPAESSTESTLNRCLASVGLSGLLGATTPKTTAKDMFMSVTMPGSAAARATLAYHWIKTAADSNFAPALRPLVEILSTEHLPCDTGLPEQQTLPYKSQGEWADAIYLGTEAEHNAPSIAAQVVKNPIFNEELAKEYVAKVYYALVARDLWNKFKRSFRPVHGHYTINSQPAFTQFKDVCTKQTQQSWQYLEPWVKYTDVFELWGNEMTEYQALKDWLSQTVETHQWEIRDPQGKLLLWPASSTTALD